MGSNLMQLNICMLGTGNVGKSALTLQFMYEEFVEDYEPTKSDSYARKINVDNTEVNVSILDTAGQESYGGVIDTVYRWGDGFLIVFSITDRESFDAVRPALDRFLMVRPTERIPRVLVGNKADLEPERQVSTAEAQQLASQWGIPYIETSAKTCYNVERVYMGVAREILRIKLGGMQQVQEHVASNSSECCSIL